VSAFDVFDLRRDAKSGKGDLEVLAFLGYFSSPECFTFISLIHPVFL